MTWPQWLLLLRRGPADPSQLLSHQRAANLRRGSSSKRQRNGRSVTVSGSQHLSTSSPSSLSATCTVGLAPWQQGYSPAGSAHQPTTLHGARRKNQPTQIREIRLQPNPSGSVLKKVVKQQHQLLPACVRGLANFKPGARRLHFVICSSAFFVPPVENPNLNSPRAAGSKLSTWCSNVSTMNLWLGQRKKTTLIRWRCFPTCSLNTQLHGPKMKACNSMYNWATA